MRAALHGRRTVATAGMQVAPPLRPATSVRGVPLPPAVTNTFVPALVPRMTSRRRKVLSAQAILAVLIVIPLAFALDSSSHAPTKPATTSTPAPVPASNPAPPPPAATEQPPVQPWPGPGKGHGKGHGGDGGD
jgi:serine/threonine-protein kinase